MFVVRGVTFMVLNPRTPSKHQIKEKTTAMENANGKEALVEAFVVPVPQLSTPPHHPSVALAMSTTTGTTRMSEEQRVATIAGGPVHVKKAGGGVPMVQAGDRSSFWDPEDYLPKCSPK